MSRTYRKVIHKETTEEIFVGERQTNKGIVKGKKLKPYTKENKIKFKAGTYTGIAPTKEQKEEVRNANRSLKKGKRQELKLELKREILELKNIIQEEVLDGKQ